MEPRTLCKLKLKVLIARGEEKHTDSSVLKSKSDKKLMIRD